MTPYFRKPTHSMFHTLARVLVYLPVYFWMTLDLLCALGAFILAHWLSPYYPVLVTSAKYDIHLTGIAYAVLVVLLWHIMGLYHPGHLRSLTRIILTAMATVFMALVGLSVILYWSSYTQLSRYVVLIVFVLTVCLLILLRVLSRGLAARFKRTVVFIGRAQQFGKFKKELKAGYNLFFNEPVFLDVEHVREPTLLKQEVDRLLKTEPTELVVEDQPDVARMVMKHCVQIASVGCIISKQSKFHETLHQEVDLDTLEPYEYLENAVGVGSYYGLTIKRILDIGISFILIAAFAPVILALIPLICVTSRGQVFYKQARVGLHGRLFNMYKLCTMFPDDGKSDPTWAKADDARLTSMGKILRQTRLNEVPQLWNVLKGDMSIVGPRPELPNYVKPLEEKIPYYYLRHIVKPGLTGWAQIRFRYGSTFEDVKRKLSYDLYYVGHYGLLFDVAIILRTIMLMAKGSR